jgi:hypothetical protein
LPPVGYGRSTKARRVEDGLVMRKEADGKHSYALCNAAAETPLAQLAEGKCQRYFIERSNPEAKSELGWDENSRRRNTAPGNIIGP